jgi:hypothetical protein
MIKSMEKVYSHGLVGMFTMEISKEMREKVKGK